MNVYVESNFVVEAALEQSEAGSCERLLELAHSGRIQLAIPAYALLEPAETITRRLREFEDVTNEVSRHLAQLRRTAALQVDADALAGLNAKASQAAALGLQRVRKRLLDDARVLEVDLAALKDAEDAQAVYSMKLPDAVILACVLRDPAFGKAPSLFLNKNRKDFYDNDVRQRLEAGKCRVITSFAQGVAFLENALKTAP